MLTVLDLFSGIGGFSLGLERTGGFETIAFCEIDSFCRAVLAKHWPGIQIHEDIKTLYPSIGFADVICGGFPCQDISIAGKGAGLEGERSGLWREYARIIDLVRPRYVIVENVAALLHRGLDTVLGDLATLGFDAEWHCIPASAVGAPQLRDRIWIIAYLNSSENGRDGNDTTIQKSTNQIEKTQQRKDGEWGGARYGNGIENGDAPLPITSINSTRIIRFFYKKICREPQFSWCENIRGPADFFGRPDIPNPLIRRNDNRSSRRVDRCGNAVVPQIPEIIGRAILEMEKTK